MSQRNAKEPVLDGMIGIGSGLYALGIVPLPPSLANQPTLGRLATAILFVGCMTAILGYVWPHRDDGMSIQQAAQPLVFFGCAFYAIALVTGTTSLGNALLAVAYTSGVGLAALARWVQLRHRIQARTEHLRRNGDA